MRALAIALSIIAMVSVSCTQKKPAKSADDQQTGGASAQTANDSKESTKAPLGKPDDFQPIDAGSASKRK